MTCVYSFSLGIPGTDGARGDKGDRGNFIFVSNFFQIWLHT